MDLVLGVGRDTKSGRHEFKGLEGGMEMNDLGEERRNRGKGVTDEEHSQD